MTALTFHFRPLSLFPVLLPELSVVMDPKTAFMTSRESPMSDWERWEREKYWDKRKDETGRDTQRNGGESDIKLPACINGFGGSSLFPPFKIESSKRGLS